MRIFDYRTIWWSPICHVVETEPQMISVKMGRRLRRIMLPYVQYSKRFNKLTVTFSNEPARLFSKVYLNPFQNNVGINVCMGRPGVRPFSSMNKTINYYWNSSFLDDCLVTSYPFDIHMWEELSKTKDGKKQLLETEWGGKRKTLWLYSSTIAMIKETGM